MDFVVSKVALSICALLVAGVLGSLYGDGALRDVRGELEGVARDFLSVASAALDAREECLASWEVPRLSGGEMVSVALSMDHVRVSTSLALFMIAAPFAMHTWSWNGTSVNESAVAELDASAPGVAASSGGVITVRTMIVDVGNDRELMVFVQSGA